MKQTSNVLKVTRDMFQVQFNWAIGFLGVMVVIHIFRIMSMVFFGGSDVDGYYMSVFIAANIFMFIIGIISIYFLPHYVQNGVTRKDYFKGTVLAAIGLSAVIPVVTLVLSVMDRFILVNIAGIQLAGTDINSVVSDINTAVASGDMIGEIIGNIVSHTVLAFILTPYVDPGSHWILAVGVFAVNIFMYYLFGWLISASFCRFGIIAGLGFIVMAIMFIMLGDTFLRDSLDLPVYGWFAGLDALPLSRTLLGLLLIIVVTICTIRQLTKRVSVKM